MAKEWDGTRSPFDAAPRAMGASAVSDEQIREVFLANGFTVKEGQTDLKPYVFAAARALLALAQPETSRADQAEEDAYVIDRLGNLLAGVAITLKGPDLAQHRHSYHDLAEVAEKMVIELELYRATYGETLPEPSREVERDAARYRWLRHADLDTLADANWGEGEVYEGEDFDRAIDAAMTATPAAGDSQ